MAYTVARPNGSFEVRESRATTRGPRATTLATFRVLDDAVLARAAERAGGRLDRDAVLRSARRAGAPVDVGVPVADAAARALVRECTLGRPPSPVLAALVTHVVHADRDLPDPVIDAAMWAGATLAERGAALRDLLLLADQLPSRRTEGGRFPRLPTP